MSAFKSQFFETAHHYGDLGEHSRQFAAFLTHAALEAADGYTAEDYQSAIGTLPQKGINEAAQALSHALEGSGGQRKKLEKPHPALLAKVWPKESS